MSKNKSPDWKSTHPANDPECEIVGLPEKSRCYPKSDNPLLDYRKSRGSAPCGPEVDSCELSTENMVFPDASPEVDVYNEEWILVNSDAVTVTCEDLYYSNTHGKWDEWPVYGVNNSLTMPAGTFNEYVLDPKFKQGTDDYAKYIQYIATVKEKLTEQAKQRAISEIVCALRNPQTDLSCPSINDRPPVYANTVIIPEGQFKVSITVPASTPKTEQAYFDAANLPQVKKTLMHSVYTSLVSQLGCSYGNAIKTACCKYTTLPHFFQKTWVLYLTPQNTVIDFDILKSTFVYISSAGTLSIEHDGERWGKIAYDIKYIPNNFNFETQTYDWSVAPNDVIPVYPIFRQNGKDLEHKFVRIATQNLITDWGIPEDGVISYIEQHSQSIAQNFNTVKGGTATYNDPVTINGFPSITSDYPFTSVLNFEGLASEFDNMYTRLDAEKILTIAGTAASNRSDNNAQSRAESSLVCAYSNNEMVLKCPPSKVLITGGDTIRIPAFVTFRKNLYDANYHALTLYLSQLQLCTSGNIPIVAFCDKADLMEYVETNKTSIGTYDIKSFEDLDTPVDDGGYRTDYGDYVYPKTDAEKTTQILLIYRHDFCRTSQGDSNECYIHDTTVDYGVTAENCRAVPYASIARYEVYRNQFQSPTRTVVENNSDAIKMARANISCMYGNLKTDNYPCGPVISPYSSTEEFIPRQYGINIPPSCGEYKDASYPGCTSSTVGEITVSTCVVQEHATHVEQNFYLSDDPCEASEMAARITLATRVCLDCDKVGTPTPTQPSQVNVQTEGTSCGECQSTCCWAL